MCTHTCINPCRHPQVSVYLCTDTVVYTGVCMGVYMNEPSMCTCTHTYTHVYTRTYTHVYTHTHVYTCMHTHVCIHMYVHTRMYTHVYTHTYVRTLTPTSAVPARGRSPPTPAPPLCLGDPDPPDPARPGPAGPPVRGVPARAQQGRRCQCRGSLLDSAGGRVPVRVPVRWALLR
uniref:Uncharacterized protein n=1 Tax=Melopsittacus undulatus TaxID=13146 RepID=A0A8V5FYN6_MELUD